MGQLRVERPEPGRARTRPDAVHGDKPIPRARSAPTCAAAASSPSSPSQMTRNAIASGGALGGRPPRFDADNYKGRNVIERGFCDTKQWRGLATRYDKLAVTYRGAAVLRAITLWLKRLGDTP